MTIEHIVIKPKYQGFDFIKIYSYVTGEEYHTILSTAKKLNLYTAGHIPFQVGLDGVLAAGMDEIAHIEELLWEFSDLDRQRYFESEGEWMAYAVRTTFDRFSAYLELNPQDREQKIATLVAAILNKLKGRSIPVCTTLVLDDVIVERMILEPSRLEKGRILSCCNKILWKMWPMPAGSAVSWQPAGGLIKKPWRRCWAKKNRNNHPGREAGTLFKAFAIFGQAPEPDNIFVLT